MNISRAKKQTFVIEVVEHQKYTWQGQIHWIQGNKKVTFRSVMEMLHLMDSVILEEGKGLPEAGWEEDK